jgi:hypothetical protein
MSINDFLFKPLQPSRQQRITLKGAGPSLGGNFLEVVNQFKFFDGSVVIPQDGHMAGPSLGGNFVEAS